MVPETKNPNVVMSYSPKKKGKLKVEGGLVSWNVISEFLFTSLVSTQT